MNVTVSRFHTDRTVITDSAIISISSPVPGGLMYQALKVAAAIKARFTENSKEEIAGWRSATKPLLCKATDLPSELSRDPRWPKMRADDKAIIYPRLSITTVNVTGLR